MDIIWNKITELAEQNDGLIKTGMVEKAGIGRHVLKRYLEKIVLFFYERKKKHD